MTSIEAIKRVTLNDTFERRQMTRLSDDNWPISTSNDAIKQRRMTRLNVIMTRYNDALKGQMTQLNVKWRV